MDPVVTTEEDASPSARYLTYLETADSSDGPWTLLTTSAITNPHWGACWPGPEIATTCSNEKKSVAKKWRGEVNGHPRYVRFQIRVGDAPIVVFTTTPTPIETFAAIVKWESFQRSPAMTQKIGPHLEVHLVCKNTATYVGAIIAELKVTWPDFKITIVDTPVKKRPRDVSTDADELERPKKK